MLILNRKKKHEEEVGVFPMGDKKQEKESAWKGHR